MANAATVSRVEQGSKMLQGAFSDMWFVTATITDTDAITASDTMSISLTVPGVALGDMVIGTSLNLDTFDGDGDGCIVYGQVTSANTVSLVFHADGTEFAADAVNDAVVKMVVGRPSW